jgi:general stress protein YciG
MFTYIEIDMDRENEREIGMKGGRKMVTVIKMNVAKYW